MPLSKILNQSMKTGAHPECLKLARVIPIYKKGSKLEVCNHRPISLLSNINKRLEKLSMKEYIISLRNSIVWMNINLEIEKVTQPTMHS